MSKPVMSVFLVSVHWVCDGDANSQNHGAYLTRESAEKVKDSLPAVYADDYGPGFWEREDLESDITEMYVYE